MFQTRRQIPVHYSVEVPDDCGKPAPDPITVEVPEGSTAIDVMIKAVDIDVKYKFTATSFGEKLGFFINIINGIPESKDPNCYWLFLVKDGIDPPHPANVGVSSYRITGPMSMILRYACSSSASSQCPGES